MFKRSRINLLKSTLSTFTLNGLNQFRILGHLFGYDVTSHRSTIILIAHPSAYYQQTYKCKQKSNESQIKTILRSLSLLSHRISKHVFNRSPSFGLYILYPSARALIGNALSG